MGAGVNTENFIQGGVSRSSCVASEKNSNTSRRDAGKCTSQVSRYPAAVGENSRVIGCFSESLLSTSNIRRSACVERTPPRTVARWGNRKRFRRLTNARTVKFCRWGFIGGNYALSELEKRFVATIFCSRDLDRCKPRIRMLWRGELSGQISCGKA